MSRFLLDTHILLWYADADPRLSVTASDQIRRAEKLVFSAASIWELCVKVSVGKLAQRDFPALAQAAGCDLLDISSRHAAETLTLRRSHRDPFDHLLLAQAKVEGLTLLTHDAVLVRYGVPVLLV